MPYGDYIKDITKCEFVIYNFKKDYFSSNSNFKKIDLNKLDVTEFDISSYAILSVIANEGKRIFYYNEILARRKEHDKMTSRETDYDYYYK